MIFEKIERWFITKILMLINKNTEITFLNQTYRKFSKQNLKQKTLQCGCIRKRVFFIIIKKTIFYPHNYKSTKTSKSLVKLIFYIFKIVRGRGECDV